MDPSYIPAPVLTEAKRLIEFWMDEEAGPEQHLTSLTVRAASQDEADKAGNLAPNHPDHEPCWIIACESIEIDGTEHDEHQVMIESGMVLSAVGDGIESERRKILAPNAAQRAVIEEQVRTGSSMDEIERYWVAGYGYGDEPGDTGLAVRFQYTQHGEDGVGLEVTVFDEDGTVVDSQDFG